MILLTPESIEYVNRWGRIGYRLTFNLRGAYGRKLVWKVAS